MSQVDQEQDFSLAGILERSASAYGRRKAIVCGDNALTFQGLNDRTNALGASLSGHGIGHGDKVAIFMSNCVEYLETILAVAKLIDFKPALKAWRAGVP